MPYSIRTRLRVFRRNRENFLQRRNPLACFIDSDHAQALHALADRLVLNDRRAGALDDETTDRFGNGQDLNDGGAARVASTLATLTARALVEGHTFLRLETELGQDLRLRVKFLFAVGTHATDQPLCAGEDA